MKRSREEIKHALFCCIRGQCAICEYDDDEDCTGDLAEDVLEWLDQLILREDKVDLKADVLQIVKAALEQGGQCITILPDGKVTVWPWQETARWIEEPDRENQWHCSKCRYVIGLAGRAFKYCPECGTEMEAEDETA